MSEFKWIRVSKEVHKELALMGESHETFNDVITRVVKDYKALQR